MAIPPINNGHNNYLTPKENTAQRRPTNGNTEEAESTDNNNQNVAHHPNENPYHHVLEIGNTIPETPENIENDDSDEEEVYELTHHFREPNGASFTKVEWIPVSNLPIESRDINRIEIELKRLPIQQISPTSVSNKYDIDGDETDNEFSDSDNDSTPKKNRIKKTGAQQINQPKTNNNNDDEDYEPNPVKKLFH